MLIVACWLLSVATLGSESTLTFPVDAAAVKVAVRKEADVTRPRVRAPKTLLAGRKTPVPRAVAPMPCAAAAPPVGVRAGLSVVPIMATSFVAPEVVGFDC